MRPIISFMAAALLVVGGSTASAEATSTEPEKTGTSAPATPATTEDSDKAASPAAQTIIVKPRESGLDQPLCTGE